MRQSCDGLYLSKDKRSFLLGRLFCQSCFATTRGPTDEVNHEKSLTQKPSCDDYCVGGPYGIWFKNLYAFHFPKLAARDDGCLDWP